MRRGLTLFLILLLLSVASAAHDFYLLPEAFRVVPGAKVRVAFHNGDSFPESEAAPSLARLRNAQLRSAGNSVSVEGLKLDGKRALGSVDVPARGGILLLSAQTAPNFIELTADKFLAYVKEEGLTIVVNWRAQHGEASRPGRERYSKFAKALLLSGRPDDFYKQAIGFPIEIVPEVSPYDLHPGGVLPVRVIFRGKPASDLQLEAAWSDNTSSKTKVIGRTDAAGRIRIPIAAAGKWRLHTLTMERCAEPAAADWESFWASLTFEIR